LGLWDVSYKLHGGPDRTLFNSLCISQSQISAAGSLLRLSSITDSHPFSLTLTGGGGVSTEVAKKSCIPKSTGAGDKRGSAYMWQREGRGKEEQDHRQEVQSTQTAWNQFI